MGADPFFKMLGMVLLLLWQIVKGLCLLLFWVFTLGKWKLETASFQRRQAAQQAANEAAAQVRDIERKKNNTLYGGPR